MRDWTLAVKHYPSDQANVVLKSTSVHYDENGNIPKSSIMALARCLYSVLQSKHIGERTKSSLAIMVFNIYFDLRASGKFDPYAQVLLEVVSAGNSYEKDNHQYKKTLAALFAAEKHEFLITKINQHVLDIEKVLN